MPEILNPLPQALNSKSPDQGKGFWLESKNGSEMTLAKLQSLQLGLRPRALSP